MDDGWVTESAARTQAEAGDPRRRYYQITAVGQAVLRAEAARIVALARSGHVRKLAQDARVDRA
jgi:DNA-binding PadR family transcriptional regulator